MLRAPYSFILCTLALAVACSKASSDEGSHGATANAGTGGTPAGSSGGSASGAVGSAGTAAQAGGGGTPSAGASAGGMGGTGGNPMMPAGAGAGGVAGNPQNLAGSGGADGGGIGLPPPLEDCPGPSIDRLQQWNASGEGTTVPPTGTLLQEAGGDYVANIEFVGDEWHVMVVLVANEFEASVDLSASSGFWLTYSATADFYVQMRPALDWSGGDKFLTAIPGTNGEIVTEFFSFAEEDWTTHPGLGQPTYTYAEGLADVRGLVFVGDTPNVISYSGLRIDGYEPPCL